MTRQVAGDRLEVRSLVPYGVDPHGYEPTPQDVAAVARARMIVVNGAGLESFIAKLITNAGGDRPLVEASAGLAEPHRPRGGGPGGRRHRRGPVLRAGPALLAGPGHGHPVRAEHPGRAQPRGPGGEPTLRDERAMRTSGSCGSSTAWIAGAGGGHPAGEALAGHQPREPRVLRGPLRVSDRRHGDPEREHGGLADRAAARAARRRLEEGRRARRVPRGGRKPAACPAGRAGGGDPGGDRAVHPLPDRSPGPAPDLPRHDALRREDRSCDALGGGAQ